MEIVTEPVLESPEEAGEFLLELRKLVRYLEICDGNMEQGSLRCDANISLRKKGAETLGVKVEVKNLNSIRNVRRALEFEINRQAQAIDNNEPIIQGTRGFDPSNGSTFATRAKEMAHDYRYFPEPDLPPLVISNEKVQEVRKKMPVLPSEMSSMLINDFSLTTYEAGVISEEKDIGLFFISLAKESGNFKSAANWMIGPMKSYLNESGLSIKESAIGIAQLSQLIKMVDTSTISQTAASQNLFDSMVKRPGSDPLALAKELNLIQQSDEGQLNDYVAQVIRSNSTEVAAYKNGKKGLIGYFMGEVMKLSGGAADPKIAKRLILEALNT